MKKIISLVIATVFLLGFLPAMEVTAAFTPRDTPPDISNPYYKLKSAGGYNVFGRGNDPNNQYPNSALPNCTAYAWGRAYEILGSRPSLSTGNANLWYGYNDGYARGSTPKVGAIACWSSQHVAVVERIVNGVVYVSESTWGLSNPPRYFRYGEPLYSLSSSSFQGYIYLPVDTTPPPLDIGDDYYALISSPHYAGMYLTNDGTNVSLRKYRATKDQIWHFSRASDGSYRFTSYADGKCLEIAGVTSGSNVQVYTDNATVAQRWYVEGSNANYTFRSKQCNYVIDISGYGNEGDNIQVFNSNNTKNQKFAVEKVFPSTHSTVSYDANGGVNSPIRQEKISGLTLILSDVIPVRSGHIFLGWATTSDATVAAYQPGDRYIADVPVTFYAVWKQENTKLYTQTTVTKNENYNFNINIYNVDGNATLILATYNSAGKLVEMKTTEVISATANVPLSMSKNLGATNAKVMVWDRENIMRPLCAPERIPSLP